MKSKPLKLCWKCTWVNFYCGLWLAPAELQISNLEDLEIQVFMASLWLTHCSAASLKTCNLFFFLFILTHRNVRLGESSWLTETSSLMTEVPRDAIPFTNCSGSLWKLIGFWSLVFAVIILRYKKCVRKCSGRRALHWTQHSSYLSPALRRGGSPLLTCWQWSSYCNPGGCWPSLPEELLLGIVLLKEHFSFFNFYWHIVFTLAYCIY